MVANRSMVFFMPGRTRYAFSFSPENRPITETPQFRAKLRIRPKFCLKLAKKMQNKMNCEYPISQSLKLEFPPKCQNFG